MRIHLEKGETLFEALKKQNVRLNAACGGQGSCGGCTVDVEQFGKVKACRFRIPGSYEVSVPKPIEFQAVGLTAENAAAIPFSPKEGWDSYPVIAVDLGTTTVALAGFYNGQQRTASFTNPQRLYGADVMSRIRQANEGKLEELSSAIRQALEIKLQGLAAELSDTAERARVVIAGNTAMLHLLFGMDCSGLGKAPFAPETLEMVDETWNLSDRGGQKLSCRITALSGISAFVGADIVSGIYALSVQKRTDTVLFIDLGTNGEMVLAHGTSLYAASTAAGPAFEGNELAAQLYGAGIMHWLNKMLQNHDVDKMGTLCEEYFDKGYPIPSEDGTTLYFTQDIIREIQMAKAAIRAGIEVLLEEAKLKAGDVDEVILAGGMGYFIKPSDAVGIGLLPESLLQKTTAAGNASLLGAIRYLMEGAARADAQILQIRKRTKNVILAKHPHFAEYYIREMNF